MLRPPILIWIVLFTLALICEIFKPKSRREESGKSTGKITVIEGQDQISDEEFNQAKAD